MNKKTIIEIKGLTAAYEDKIVLTDINLTVEELDFLVIVGPNGGGKTTLIKNILGLMKPKSGTIRFYKDGKETEELTIGYLPQYHSIDKKFPISVYEVILSGLSQQKSLWKRYSKEQHERVKNTILRMGLKGLEQRAIGELSGGQLQRVLLGRAIVSNPDVIILDEPNTYIDEEFQTKLYHVLKEINERSAVILISHDLHSAMQLAKSVIYINHRLEVRPKEMNYEPNNTK